MAMVRKSRDIIDAGRVDWAKVDATTEEEIRAQLIEDGQDPDAPLGDFVVRIPPAEVRKRTGLSQEAFARAIGVPAATLRNWEQGRTPPDPAALSLLALVADDPERALDVLAGRRRHAG